MFPKNSENAVYRAVESGELQIDLDGRIWRVSARRWNRWIGTTLSIPCLPRRAEKLVPTGYMMVRAMFGKVRTAALAHRLVWLHFRGVIPKGLTINHKNGIKHDNRIENLELATPAQQTAHAMAVLGWNPSKNLKQFRG